VRWGEEAEEGETLRRVTESLIRASSISLGTSGIGFVQLRHVRTSWYDQAAGRKRGDAKRRAKLYGVFQIYG
jgi:hypothetical protein